MASGNRKNPTRAASSESRYSFMEFTRRFPDDESCLVYLWTTRYAPDGQHAHCPKCGVERSFKRYETTQQRQSWTCTKCGQHIHPTAGTIFHKSSTSLHLWFYALYIMASTRCGVAAKQLERELGVTYKTAWRMFHLIRTQLMEQDDEMSLSGEVEVDETYVGPKRSGRKDRGRGHDGKVGRGASHKTPVFGMVERGGRVSAYTVENASAGQLMPHLQKRILPASIIYSDEWAGYNSVKRAGYEHRRIAHSAGVYVSGEVHTQTIEGFWSLLKRGLAGAHHAVSAKHLQGYLNEYVWRYNHRNDVRSMFETLLARAALTAL